ncbi:MAG TPA: hypothetical protein VHY79_11655 [Rhizomicrobium sp.]|jgi:hypothetical protein|nr:hypothetical protein [Rhizomicrobium sp.]
MWRAIAGIVAGFVAWWAVATILDIGLRLWLPGYVQAEHAMLFTLPMKIARLSIAVVAAVAAGAVVRVVAPASRWAPWIAGLVLLLLFVPVHAHIWSKFPVWYHLTFLLTLAPLVVIGAHLWPHGATGTAESGKDVVGNAA